LVVDLSNLPGSNLRHWILEAWGWMYGASNPMHDIIHLLLQSLTSFKVSFPTMRNETNADFVSPAAGRSVLPGNCRSSDKIQNKLTQQRRQEAMQIHQMFSYAILPAKLI
jgi:hypothetical protein